MDSRSLFFYLNSSFLQCHGFHQCLHWFCTYWTLTNHSKPSMSLCYIFQQISNLYLFSFVWNVEQPRFKIVLNKVHFSSAHIKSRIFVSHCRLRIFFLYACMYMDFSVFIFRFLYCVHFHCVWAKKWKHLCVLMLVAINAKALFYLNTHKSLKSWTPSTMPLPQSKWWTRKNAYTSLLLWPLFDKIYSQECGGDWLLFCAFMLIIEDQDYRIKHADSFLFGRTNLMEDMEHSKMGEKVSLSVSWHSTQSEIK